MKGEQTLPKTHRIRRSGEYRQIRRAGKRYHTPHFLVIINPAQDPSRLGITVSRKVGHAVYRNRLKRWLREWFRNHHRHFGRTVDVSIIAKPHAGGLSHVQVDREILTVFARLETDPQ